MRRFPVLLLTAALCAAPASPALAQSAGDEQYQDPFAQDGSGSTGSGQDEALSQTPQAPTTPQPSGGGGGGDEPAQVAPRNQLPNTGTDAHLLALAGASLLLMGTGLRLRTIPERF